MQEFQKLQHIIFQLQTKKRNIGFDRERHREKYISQGERPKVIGDYSDVYIHIKGTLKVLNINTAAAPNNRNKKPTLKYCDPCINWLSEINNTQIDSAHDVYVSMLMYNLKEFSDIFSTTSGNLWRYYRNEPVLNNNGNMIDFSNDDNNSILFKIRISK